MEEIRCPFLNMFFNAVVCPYLKGNLCDEIDTNVGNSDAWCTSQIEQNLSKIDEAQDL